jgi:hypothetical protein
MTRYLGISNMAEPRSLRWAAMASAVLFVAPAVVSAQTISAPSSVQEKGSRPFGQSTYGSTLGSTFGTPHGTTMGSQFGASGTEASPPSTNTTVFGPQLITGPKVK